LLVSVRAHHPARDLGAHVIDARTPWYDIDRWPRWLLIAYYITFPVSGPTLFALILLGYMFVSPVVMLGMCIYVSLPARWQRWPIS
jgi:hypothetical protein